MIYGTVRTVCFINVWHCVWICGFHMSQPGVCCHGNVSSFLFMNTASQVSQGHIPPAGPHLRQRVMSPLFKNTQTPPPCKHSRSHHSTSFPYGHYSFMMIQSDSFAFMMCSWMYSVGSDRQMVLLSFNLSRFLTPPCWNHSCASDSSPLCSF